MGGAPGQRDPTRRPRASHEQPEVEIATTAQSARFLFESEYVILDSLVFILPFENKVDFFEAYCFTGNYIMFVLVIVC